MLESVRMPQDGLFVLNDLVVIHINYETMDAVYEFNPSEIKEDVVKLLVTEFFAEFKELSK